MLITDIRKTEYREVLDKTLLGELFHPANIPVVISARYSVAHARLAAGTASLPHTLKRSSEAYYILSGTGRMHIGSGVEVVQPGQFIYIPPGEVQYIENIGTEELVFLAIVDPMWDASDEIRGITEPPTADKADPFLAEAIKEAELGLSEGGIPIGSVLVRDGLIIGRGHNRRVQEQNPMNHAEIDCLMNAGRMQSYRDCILYSTLMPCYLCAGAVIQFGIPRVVVGESRTFSGARELLQSHGIQVTDHDNRDCIRMMTAFIRSSPDLWNEDIGMDEGRPYQTA